MKKPKHANAPRYLTSRTKVLKLGLERRKKEGKLLERPKGSKDKNYRKKSGYYLRYKNR